MKAGRQRITVDRTRCIGAGNCVFTAPAIFDQNEDDGRVVLLAETVAGADAERAAAAVRQCPSGAIAMREEAGG